MWVHLDISIDFFFNVKTKSSYWQLLLYLVRFIEIFIMKPLARWTIGNTNKDGYECLFISINSFLRFYDADVVVCYNCPLGALPQKFKQFCLIDQTQHLSVGPEPKGVAWKLYPPRIDINRHEICIDNDVVFNSPIEQIKDFFQSNSTLLLECVSRTYGRFERHVPPGFRINSGVYGMPPGFNLEPFIRFYAGDQWEKNALHKHDKNETFDEQGIIALALLTHSRYVIIPNKDITNCEIQLIPAKGHHFIGLNRRKCHYPFRLYRSLNKKLYL